VQLLTLIIARDRNNIVKISQRIDLRITLRSTPYTRHTVGDGWREQGENASYQSDDE